MFVRIGGLIVRWTMWTIAIAWIHFSSFIAPLAMRVEYSPEKYRSLERLAVTIGTPIWEWSAWLLAPIASFIFATDETKVYNLFVNSRPRDGASYIAFFVLVLMMVFFLGILPTVWRRVLATLHVNMPAHESRRLRHRTSSSPSIWRIISLSSTPAVLEDDGRACWASRGGGPGAPARVFWVPSSRTCPLSSGRLS